MVGSGKDITIEELREQGYKGFYVASRSAAWKKTGYHRRECKDTYAAVDFLREAGAKKALRLKVILWLSAVVIWPSMRRESAAVVWMRISMFCLEQRENMPASKEEIAEALEERLSRAELRLGDERSAERRKKWPVWYLKNVSVYWMNREDFTGIR